MKKWLLIVLVLCAAGVTVWLFRGLSTPSNSRPEVVPSQTVQTPSLSEPFAAIMPSKAQPSPPLSNGAPIRAEAQPVTPGAPNAVAPLHDLASPSGAALGPELPSTIPPAMLLENMRTTVRQYGLLFGGNPIGTNPEITKSLNGDNPKHVNFLGPDGNHVNEKGELVDPWGTPYFFHQLSAMEMEIRSAGPDKTMWTSDDLVIK